jgi:hypothetical protein
MTIHIINVTKCDAAKYMMIRNTIVTKCDAAKYMRNITQLHKL